MSDVITVNQSFAVLEGRHSLTVSSLSREEGAFSVRYTIAPPLPGDQGPSEFPVFMWVEASDDVGHVYSDGGGARGLSDDGTHTAGVISAQPALPQDARELRIRFVFLHGDQEGGPDLTIALA